MQLYVGHPNLNNLTIPRRRLPVIRKQSNLLRARVPILKDLDRPTPRVSLAIVDLTKIENVPLHNAPIRLTAVLHNAPVSVNLAILLSLLGPKEHARSVAHPLQEPSRG